MGNLPLEVTFRSDMSKRRTKDLRRQGFATGSVFGHNSESVSLEVSVKNLVEQIKKSSAGAMTLFDLKIKDAPSNVDGPVVLKDFYKDPLTRKVIDIQFQRISMTEKINMTVPIKFVGVAAGIKNGGILDEGVVELNIRCLPGKIPTTIDIDVSHLEAGQHISVSDLDLGEGMEIASDDSTIICSCVLSRAAEAEGDAAEVAAAAEKA